MRTAIVIAFLSCAVPGIALAQASGPGTPTTTFDVKQINFDSWCQNTQRYSADRCQARRPEDVKAFEDYRGAVERYEFDYLKRVQKDQDFQTQINRDPTSTVSGRLDATP